MTSAEELRRAVVAVMVPLPAQGHLNQLLHLSRLVSAHNIPVHFAGTATHLRQAKTRVHGWNPTTPAINFHELPTPPFDNPPPDPDAATKFPAQLIPSLKATTHLRQPVFDLVTKLSATARRIVTIYDSSIAYVVQDIKSISNAESYSFQSISAFSLFSFYWEFTGKPENLPTEAQIIREVPSMEGCFSPEFFEFTNLQQEAPKFSSGDIYNTSRVIEGFYIDLLAKEKSTGTDNNWAIGPFNPVFLSKKTPQENASENHSNNRHKCLEWLDKQAPDSVIFVSFGTTSSLSNEQISELALGLERSDRKFLWVLRDADKGDIFDGDVRKPLLPENYEERLQERGLIVRDWAPQLEIFQHPSIGGFVTHCGWNSCIESISMGVPVATWPMHSDQPRNAVLMVKVLKIGVEIKDWARRDEVVSAERVEKVVRRLMASSEGNDMRKRARELGQDVKKSLMDGGVGKKEIDSFISHISR